jgi:GNAT superfamily N-acetyltransferase
MSVETVRGVEAGEASALAGVMARAFEQDPMSVHLLPDAGRRVAALEHAFRALLRRVYMPPGECYTTAGVKGGALWMPPGTYPPAARLRLTMLPTFARVFGLSGMASAMRDINRMERMHPKSRPHWYLAFLGVEPSEQGRGFGGSLLLPVLGRCDAAATPAYLETSNDRNLPLYLRHGFRVIDECDIPCGPHFWGMWREPRA